MRYLHLLLILIVLTSCSTESTPVYNLITSSEPAEAGTVTPTGGSYDEGTEVEISSVPEEDWVFERWQGDLSGTQNPVMVTMNSDKNIIALYSRQTYPLTITVVGEGTVQESVIQQKTEYEEGTLVELLAVPADGWRFTGWSGETDGNENPVSITVNTPVEVTATFERRDYPLTITTQGQGSVTEEIVQQKTTDYPYETIVELTANPSEGWEFEGWQGDIETSENPTTVTIEGETEVTAVFSGVEYSLEVTVEGQGSVSEELLPSKTNYDAGALVKLTAEPEDNWIFSQWSGDLEGEENPKQITIDEPKEVTATFLRTYTLTTFTSPEQGGTITPEQGQYVRDQTLEVEANSAGGWRFVEWEGDFSGNTNPFNLTMNGDKTLTANFERKDYNFSIDVSGEGAIDIELLSGTETDEGYLFESELRLTAEAEENWRFANWSGDFNSDDNPAELTVTKNYEITANFEEVFYLNENGLTIHCPLASPGETGTIEGVVYEAVDRDMLLDKRDSRADLSKVCTSLVQDMSELFRDWEFFESQAIGNWDVSNVEDMSRMFMKSDFMSYTEMEFNEDISAWDVSNVKDMSQMFQGAFDNNNVFNQPIGSWDVSNVENMSGMFRNSDFNQDIEGWNVSSVTDMSRMFARSDFNQPIGDWDVSNVQDMSFMFGETGAGPTTKFNQPIGDWDVSNVENMSGMFYGSQFNQPIGDWNVSNVVYMSSMFGGESYNASPSQFNQPIGNWDVGNVEEMSGMFSQSPFNQEINSWDVSNVENMSGMFAGADFNQPIGNWDVSSVTGMSNMFGGFWFTGVYSDFNQSIGNWDVSNVTNMSSMFYGSRFNQSIGDWDVSNVTDMSSMFSGRTGRNGYSLGKSQFDQNISDWDVSSVTNMAGMFFGSKFNKPIGDWEVSSVINMSSMFQASEFNQPIGDWNVGNVANMAGMFSGFEFTNDTPSIESVFNHPIGEWDTSNVADMKAMFKLATSYNQDLSGWCVSNFSEKPEDFDTETPEWVLPKPVWGTCP